MNETNPMSDASRHIRRLYVFFGVLAVSFVILAFLVWRKSPHEILRQELRDLSFQMAQQPMSPEWETEAMRIREQSIEDRIMEAKAIVLCKHSTSWGNTRCEVTRILKQVPGFELPCSVGNPIKGHERKVDRDVSPGEGTITFFTRSSPSPSSSLIINDGCVTDAHVDPSRPAHDPYVLREFTVEQVVKMIETANIRVDHISEVQ